MTTYLDLDTWNRREHFEFFRDFDNPFFNVCVQVDVTDLWRLSRADRDLSFFIACLYVATRAANEVENFRYRLRGARVLVHDQIHPGSTVLLDDDRFTFAYCKYTDDFAEFHRCFREEIERVKSGSGALQPRSGEDDLIHFSVLPWMAFTSFAHARRWGIEDSVPKIVFGKAYPTAKRMTMPVSVEVHHSLMDGLHVGRYFEALAGHLAKAEERCALRR